MTALVRTQNERRLISGLLRNYGTHGIAAQRDISITLIQVTVQCNAPARSQPSKNSAGHE